MAAVGVALCLSALCSGGPVEEAPERGGPVSPIGFPSGTLGPRPGAGRPGVSFFLVLRAGSIWIDDGRGLPKVRSGAGFRWAEYPCGCLAGCYLLSDPRCRHYQQY